MINNVFYSPTAVKSTNHWEKKAFKFVTQKIAVKFFPFNPIPRWGMGGGKKLPPHQFLLNIFFCKNRINLKILDLLSYTYMHPIQLKKYKIFDYSSVDNHPKLTKIGKNGLKCSFWAIQATVNKFFPFFCDIR